MSRIELINSRGEAIAELLGDQVYLLNGEWYGRLVQSTRMVMRRGVYMGELYNDRHLLFSNHNDCHGEVARLVPGIIVHLEPIDREKFNPVPSDFCDLAFEFLEAPSPSV
ncbi:MAG: hypothetical protein ACF8PN_05785 [Phycisphaerales bacterium]